MIELLLIIIMFIGIGILIVNINSELPANDKTRITELNQLSYEMNRKRILEDIRWYKLQGYIDCLVSIYFSQIRDELRNKGYSVRQVNNNTYEVS